MVPALFRRSFQTNAAEMNKHWHNTHVCATNSVAVSLHTTQGLLGEFSQDVCHLCIQVLQNCHNNN